jgi:Tol biopolymer transport system component
MRRTVALGLVLAVVVGLVGCDRVERITASTYQDGVRCFVPSLSGDASTVAFTSLDDPSGVTLPQASVRRDLATGASTKLAGQPSSVSPNAISADGARVVFTIYVYGGERGNDHAYLWTSRSRTRTRISPLSEDVGEVVISPDGRKVAYTEGNLRNLWLHDVGTGARRAIELPAGTSGAQWVGLDLSATGRYLAMRRVDVDALVVLDLQGTSSWTFGGGDDVVSLSAPSISDDGRLVAFSVGERANLPVVSVWDRTTRQVTSVPRSGGVFESDPVISGDGTTLATIRSDGSAASASLVVRRWPGGAARTAVTANAPIRYLSISRDGRAAAFCSRASNLAAGPVAPNLFLWRA